MSILRGAKDRVKVPVKVELVEDGEDLDVEFIAIFNRLTKPKARLISRSMRDVQVELDVLSAEEKTLDLTSESDVERKHAIADETESLIDKIEQPIRDNLIGWENLKGSDGEDVPYSDEVKEEMLSLAPYFEALQASFGDSTGKRAEVKN